MSLSVFPLVLDWDYFEECPLCSLYLSQKSVHVGCVNQKKKKKGLRAPATFVTHVSVTLGLFVGDLAQHIYCRFRLTRCYVIMNVLRGGPDSALIKGPQIMTRVCERLVVYV